MRQVCHRRRYSCTRVGIAWGVDNNLTRKIALADATWIASIKGLTAGTVNFVFAILLGAQLPTLADTGGALLLGFAAYGVSLALFVLALRNLGTARTGAYFSVAPFLGAALALLLGDTLTPTLIGGGALMAIGVWLHLTERHEHQHAHEASEHEHEHVHDDDPHHQHAHDPPVSYRTRHTHPHRHDPVAHSHHHYPDSFHRHLH